MGLELSLKPFLPPQVEVDRLGTGQAVLDRFRAIKPDLVLLDLNFPDMSGLKVLKELRQENTKVPILVITSSREASVIRNVIELGANGVLSKAHRLESFRMALQHIFNPSSKTTLLDTSVQEILNEQASSDLTPREWEVLALIARGLTNDDIANELKCSLETVKTHRSKIGQKTSSRNRAELTAWYLQRKN